MLVLGVERWGFKDWGCKNAFRVLGATLRGSWRRLGCFFGDLRPSWERLGGVLGLLGAASWGRLGGALGAKPQQERGGQLLGTDFGFSFGGSWRVLGALKGVLESIFASLGASWACLNNKLEKDSIFEVSKTFFQFFETFETLKFNVSPR